MQKLLISGSFYTLTRCLVKNSSAVVEIELERSLCLELYTDYKDLGRFMLRSGGHTIAAGLVEEVKHLYKYKIGLLQHCTSLLSISSEGTHCTVLK